MIEYTCKDCGGRIYAFRFAAPNECICSTCDWIRTHIPPHAQAVARERLGVPLSPDNDDKGPCAVPG